MAILYIRKKKLNCVMDIFKLLFNENKINPRIARYYLKILLICKRRNGFIFFSFRDMQSQSGANVNIYIFLSKIHVKFEVQLCLTLRWHISKTKKHKSNPSFAY